MDIYKKYPNGAKTPYNEVAPEDLWEFQNAYNLAAVEYRNGEIRFYDCDDVYLGC